MNIIYIVLSTIILWTACSSEYIVIYATSIAQLMIWVTALSLVDFKSLYISCMCNNSITLDPSYIPAIKIF